MPNHSLLDDDRFKIGFEFEFVIRGYDSLFLSDPDYLSVCGMNYNTFRTAFVISKKQLAQIENILSYEQYFSNSKRRFDYTEIEEMAVKFGISKLITLLKLKPRNREWYTASKTFPPECNNPYFFDKSYEINRALDALDLSDYNEVKRLARRLSHYHVRTRYIDEHGNGEEDEKYILGRVAEVFGERMGVEIAFDVYDENLDTYKNFCLKTEYLDDTDLTIDMGMEITTPPLPPREALSHAKKILGIMTERDLPFRVRLNKDCGIHVNVSYPGVKVDQVSPVYYSLMNDERALTTPFRRITQDACLPYTNNIREIAGKLIRRGLLTLDMLNTMEGLKYVVTMIEANLDYGKYTSAYFYNIHKHGYIEYRMAGGRGYTKKYKELEHHVRECLRITKSFTHDRFSDRIFADKVRRLLIKAGAKKGRPVSFPKEVFARK